jgi:hypothetical protein
LSRVSPLFRTAAREFGKVLASRAFLLSALIILPCAMFLAGLESAFVYGRLEGDPLPWQLNVSEEGSFGEWFEYALTALAAGWMAGLWRRERAPVYVAAALAFTWLTLDNALGLHEAGGHVLAPLLAGVAGERAADLGELLVFAFVAVVLVAMLRVGVRASGIAPSARMLCAMAAVAVGALFGVAMDFSAHLVDLGPAMGLVLDSVEDMGELLMLCLACAVTAGIRFSPGEDRSQAPGEAGCPHAACS